ncbi:MULTISPECIES: S1/P1 nuclease [unclassified Bradyrhizobium]|uniref:S1/P1 nuclease n=1 Tax=unclassified Bradyrhizobium TaxID=2631580 RepID=UPI00102958BB|nr:MULTISPECIES: S1/P1 nuclease [unclassified Bradyrhizobium]RZN16259.1 phospholipase [Bradyrhizobium sp. Leo121]TAI60483.1 phospholipase [Bradyrhizobium sp. Leo170]
MKKAALIALSCLVALLPDPASAWWDEGHMQIAYLAYKRLDPAIKDKIDGLLRLNPDYQVWTCGAQDEASRRTYAFVHAATWADDIKTKSDYREDRITDATAGQNVAYDKLKHSYWHYEDILFSPDGTTLPAPDPVDAAKMAKTMIATLPAASGASDQLRSYDLVWLLHLVGDLHQPLHAIARYTAELPHGDRGGNAEMVVPATGETIALHAYWDRLFGGYSSVFGAIFDADDRGGLGSVAVDADAEKVLDPDRWAQESFEAAKSFAYAQPVGLGPAAVQLTRDYETNARNTARNRAALAAARLARLLDTALR